MFGEYAPEEAIQEYQRNGETKLKTRIYNAEINSEVGPIEVFSKKFLPKGEQIKYSDGRKRAVVFIPGYGVRADDRTIVLAGS